jgi:hypothetical protein
MDTKKTYPFALMAMVISANILTHEKGLITTQQFYTDLRDLAEMLDRLNDEQFNVVREEN